MVSNLKCKLFKELFNIRCVSLGFNIFTFKQKLNHFLFNYFSVVWIYRRKVIFVDDHGLLRQPILPKFQTHVVVDFLPQLAWIGGVRNGLLVSAVFNAVDGCHVDLIYGLRLWGAAFRLTMSVPPTPSCFVLPALGRCKYEVVIYDGSVYGSS